MTDCIYSKQKSEYFVQCFNELKNEWYDNIPFDEKESALYYIHQQKQGNKLKLRLIRRIKTIKEFELKY